MTPSTRQQFRLLSLLVAASAAAGAVYTALRVPDAPEGLLFVASGAVIGAVIASCIIGFELFAADRLLERDGRRLPLAGAMAVRAAAYGVAVMAGLLLVPWVLLGRDPNPFRPYIAGDIAFSLAASFVFVAFMSVVRLLGPGTLASLLTGRYYRPREEQRIVLFLDIVGSTGIAERIGDVRFHALLSETFTILSRVVTDAGGDVYRYVGDAMIATWPLGSPPGKKSHENARAPACVLACRDALDAAAPVLQRRHGHVPAFRAGLHAGPVVAGEVGGFKREIALLGDTMNTAARVESACRDTGRPILASRTLVDACILPPDIAVTDAGTHLLRGKREPIELVALERVASGNTR